MGDTIVYRGKFKLKDSNIIYHLYINKNCSDNLYIYLNDENINIYNSKDVGEIRMLHKILNS